MLKPGVGQIRIISVIQSLSFLKSVEMSFMLADCRVLYFRIFLVILLLPALEKTSEPNVWRDRRVRR